MTSRIVASPRIVLLGLGLTLMVVAWIAATQPFGAPDEASHYDRALILTHGEILGPKSWYLPNPGLTPMQEAFINDDTRAVWVPARLMPYNVACIDDRPNTSGCYVATPSGNFPPLGYILPAIAIGVSHTTNTALWLGRAAAALQSIAFLLLAIALLWDGSGWSLLGLAAAVSPMVLFCFSILNLSGVEIASCLAFAAAVLRIARDPGHASARLWGTFGLTGVVALLTGPIDIAFVGADVLLLAGLAGLRPLIALRTRFAVRAAVAALAVGVLAALVYSRLAGFSDTFVITILGKNMAQALAEFVPVMHDAVGDFGGQTIQLPGLDYPIWWGFVIALILAALLLGDRRERLVLVATTTLALAFPILFWAWIDRFSGFGLQGREVLPELMLIPLVAGEIVRRHRTVLERVPSRGRVAVRGRAAPLGRVPPLSVLLAGVFAAVAVFQAYAWWRSARFEAGASLFLRFWAHATWQPPAGWTPWVIAAALGTLALLAFAALEVVGRPAVGVTSSLPGPPSAEAGSERLTGRA